MKVEGFEVLDGNVLGCWGCMCVCDSLEVWLAGVGGSGEDSGG